MGGASCSIAATGRGVAAVPDKNFNNSAINRNDTTTTASNPAADSQTARTLIAFGSWPAFDALFECFRSMISPRLSSSGILVHDRRHNQSFGVPAKRRQPAATQRGERRQVR